MTIFKNLFFILSTTLVIIIAFWVLGFSVFAVTSLSNNNAPYGDTKADAIIVLTGGKNRVNAGLVLLRDGKADRLLVSGTHKDVKIEDILELENMPDKWRCCIELDPIATDTLGNAHESAKWIKEHKITSIILVTSSYHIRRARNELELALSPKDIEIHEYDLPYDADKLNKPQSWLFLVGEYNKTLLSYIRRYFSREKVVT